MDMETYKTKLSEGGRVVIPAKARKALGINIGDDIVIRVDKTGDATISSVRRSVERAQRIVAKYVKGKKSLADELVEERRREGKDERG